MDLVTAFTEWMEMNFATQQGDFSVDTGEETVTLIDIERKWEQGGYEGFHLEFDNGKKIDVSIGYVEE